MLYNNYDISIIRETISIRSILLFAATLLVLVPVFFGDLLPYSIRNAMLSISCILALLLFANHLTYKLGNIGICFGWLAFAVLAIISRASVNQPFSYTQISLLLVAIVGCIVTCSIKWIRIGLQCTLVILLVHLLATLSFYFFPDLYLQTVKPLFFSLERNAIGYQSALTSHYSHNGLLMSFGLLLVISYGLNSTGKRRSIYLFIAVLFFVGLLLTQKRACLIIAILTIGIVYSILGSRGKVLRFLTFCIILVCILFIASSTLPGISESIDRLMTTFASDDMAEATTGRTFLWTHAIQGWLNNPLFGSGWGTYAYVWPGGNVTIYAHNELLQLLHDAGILGLLIFIILAILSLRIAYKNVIVIRDNHRDLPDCFSTASSFALSVELFCITYACTTGVLFQLSIVFIPYLLAIGISVSIRNYIGEYIINDLKRELN